MIKGLYDPNLNRVETVSSIERRTQLMTAGDLIAQVTRERGSDYAAPITGTTGAGLGFSFNDTWKRAQKGTMEFQLPVTQVDTINMSLRYAFENVFIGKALRIKTDFTCKGLRNNTPDGKANRFFDSVVQNLYMENLYRKAVWLYYTVGLVPILLPQPDQPLSFIEILDPRQVRVFEAFGRKLMYLVPDQRMINAVKDPKGTSSPTNKDYYDLMPPSWRDQLTAALNQRPGYTAANTGLNGEILIKLEPGSYLTIENRYNAINRFQNGWDGSPLQNYFSAAEQYRMLMGSDFATAFVAKNLIALVSIGDPEKEGDNYQRPDAQTLENIMAPFRNANGAQYMAADSTYNVRYITPDYKALSADKYDDCKEQLKNLLPSPFWFNDGNGSYASATVELKALREEVEACNDSFDRNFWTPVFDRAADMAPKAISKANRRPPVHDKNSLKDDNTWLQINQGLYADGALDVRTVLEAFGYDYDVIRQRMLDQKQDVSDKVWMPAFEGSQNIVAESTYDVSGLQAKAAAKYGPKPAAPAPGSTDTGGRPRKVGGKPQAEATTSRTPRANSK